MEKIILGNQKVIMEFLSNDGNILYITRSLKTEDYFLLSIGGESSQDGYKVLETQKEKIWEYINENADNLKITYTLAGDVETKEEKKVKKTETKTEKVAKTTKKTQKESKKTIFEELTKPEDIKTFNDIKDIYKYRYTRDRLDTEFADKMLAYTPSYKKTNKTRDNWLNTAKLYGANLHTKHAKKLSRTAVQSFYYYSPQNNLNREGKKYVKLDLVMWVKAFYEGANVGKEVKA